MNPPAWQRQAACKDHPDPDLWFPDLRSQNDREQAAKAICKTCPVAGHCLDYARTEQITFGIWGGQTPEERKARRRGPLRHGTRSCYLAGCRVAECRKANTDYMRQLRQTGRLEPIPTPPARGEGGKFVKRSS